MEPESEVIEILRKSGLEEGHIVLDFGCGSGTYSIPAAKIASQTGKVYVSDKDKESLNELMQKASSARLKNIERVDSSKELEFGLADESIDIVLLFDVFHRHYFPRREERERLLKEIYRILKPHGFLLVWPKHMESEAEAEIEKANFYLESKHSGTLVHNNTDLEEGQVLKFGKLSGGRRNDANLRL